MKKTAAKKKMLVLAGLSLKEDPEYLYKEISRLTGGADISIYFIHVLKEMPKVAYSANANKLWEDYRDRAVIDTLVKMKVYLKRFSAGYSDIEPLVNSGSPSDVIARIADTVKADLIIVGSKPVSGIIKMIKSTTAEKVVRLSSKPVLSIIL
ncbi:MAG: universal stress protein [Spirochaetota bacterium]